MPERRHNRASGRRRWLTLVLAMLACTAQAANLCQRPLKVAVSDLGLGSYVEQGQARGIIPELMQELQARSSCPLELVQLPRARALLEFDRGEIDIVTSMLRTPERDQLGAYLPYGYTKHDLLVLPDAAAGIHSLADLIRRPELRLGVVRGIRTNSRIDAHVEQLLFIRRAEYSPDYANLSAKLAARRLQAVMMPNALYIKMLRDGSLPPDIVVIDDPQARPQMLGLYVNRHAVPAAVIAALDKRLAQMVSGGWVRQTYVRHFGEAETRRMYNAAAAR